MQSRVCRYRSKVDRLLDKLVETKCDVPIEGYLDKLLTLLWQQEAKG
jgi:hypothetical protein